MIVLTRKLINTQKEKKKTKRQVSKKSVNCIFKSSLLLSRMPIPDWATPGELRIKYGKAKTLGADEETLSDGDLTEGYLQAQAQQQSK